MRDLLRRDTSIREGEVQIKRGLSSKKNNQTNSIYKVCVRFNNRIVPDELAICPNAKWDDVVLELSD